ncbi:uncharacterized protein V1516DRAFT_672357 [Lipomyces oligophaga]|uniref:uncharacterized protein n=1 Tax=Lipomyces oligophaga TaxID=45792 RepID=UPI0034D004A8
MEFTPIPILLDEVTKQVTIDQSAATPERVTEIASLVATFRDLLNINVDVPLPPNQINGRLTEQVKKLKETGNTSYKKRQFADAIRMYSLAIEMATKRVPWEASAYQRDELAILYSNRAQAEMSLLHWEEALLDADTAVYLKRPFQKAHFRKGKCLENLGRYREAKDAYELGLECGGTADGSEAEIKQSLKDVEKILADQL